MEMNYLRVARATADGEIRFSDSRFLTTMIEETRGRATDCTDPVAAAKMLLGAARQCRKTGLLMTAADICLSAINRLATDALLHYRFSNKPLMMTAARMVDEIYRRVGHPERISHVRSVNLLFRYILSDYRYCELNYDDGASFTEEEMSVIYSFPRREL